MISGSMSAGARWRLASAVAIALSTLTPATAAAANPAPAVTPALRQWTGGTGSVALAGHSRIVVDGSSARQLHADADTLADDIDSIAGQRLPVVVGGRVRPGDVLLAVDPSVGNAGGYRLTVDDAVRIVGGSAAGAFSGEQTLEQILKLGNTVPRGVALDWPQYRYRGVMLDMGRHYYSVGYVLDEIRRMAWSKLDTLHLHLTDQNAFRLVSATYPGLAAPQSYSHADIARIVDYAERYHVQLVPEIDVPAHDVPIGLYDPSLQWDCPSMNASAYQPWPGFTLDVTKPATTTFVANLLREFVPLFRHSTVFHLGGDEYPELAAQAQCPELVSYAKAHGYASTEDVVVAWLNRMGQLVRSLGRRPEIWNWWDVAGGATIAPDHDLIVNAWTGSADSYLKAGYDTVSSPDNLLYVTPEGPPGGTLEPDDPSLYQQWTPVTDPHLLGYEVSRWSDNAVDMPDAYFDWFGRRPEQVVADRIWGGPRAYPTAYDYEDAVDRVGGPPGTPAPATARLAGTPYGTSPPWSPSSTYDKAFDGDPGTFFDYSQAGGGYTGLDLGRAQAIAQIRFVPRYGYFSRMVGGVFQGCTDGPDAGCHQLAAVEWTPSADWHVLTVDDPTPYRWVRYVGPDGGFGNVAEIEFYAKGGEHVR